MLKPTKFFFFVLATATIVTIVGILGLGKFEEQQIESWLTAAGIWAPVLYILLYTIGTLFLLPSTPLNLAGGAIFGSLQGTLWTTIAAVIAAFVAFAFTRTIGRDFVLNRLSGKWLKFDKKIEDGGFLYVFSIRLIPIIPYGIVNFLAGLTSIRVKDYLCATLLGTTVGVFPFVMLGSSFRSLSKGDVIHCILGIAFVGMFVLFSTVYKQIKHP